VEIGTNSGWEIVSGQLINSFDQLLDKTILLSYNRLGYTLRRRKWNNAGLNTDMRGKVCLVTGANAGLGYTTTQKLASLGAKVYMVARDKLRGRAARDRIVKATANPNVKLELADMSSLADVRALAQRIYEQETQLDVLIHNAGVLLNNRQESVDGIELTFATNVLSNFSLTLLLLPLLKQSSPARVIFVSSGGMYTRKLNPSDLQFKQEPYNGLKAYAQSKRGQVLLSELFSEKVGGTGVTFNAMHPGWVDTPGVKNSLPGFRRVMNTTLRTPEQGADTIVWLAVAPGLEHETGKFWFDRMARDKHKVGFTQNSSPERQQFWNECHKLTHLDGPDNGLNNISEKTEQDR
jgi:dehydrogenase/reductase SDR family protein 12